MIPTVVRITKGGKEAIDIVSNDFVDNRRIWLTGEINDSSAVEIITQLEYLDRNGDGEIKLYINSPGGLVSAGLSIVDAMRRCRNDVVTVCTGMAASMGALILSCGTKGKRCATPLSEVMIHQPLGGVQGQASDIQLAAEHINRVKNLLNSILAGNTGRRIEDVARDTDRDTFLSAEQAVEYGLVDKILRI